MKINILFSPVSVEELYFTGKTSVVIDALRATTTIITALENGAKEIIPVGTVEFAVKVSGGMFGWQTLLGGERNTKKIEGFALGNSPLEYSPEIVAGKSVVLYTTNGTKAITKAKFSSNLFICAFLNIATLAKHLSLLNQDLEIICSGRSNNFSMEDSVCAGKLISEIEKLNTDLILSDSARASQSLSNSFGKNILKMMRETEHGKILIENGFEEDLKFCSKLNSSNVIPYLNGQAIKLLPDNVNSQQDGPDDKTN
ncbi:MAG: 2-phosphosulfolactate phosphatase [Ignavibacteriaceae bacterium]